MAKLYFQDLKNLKKLNPDKETINFLLAYSKALKVITSGNMKFEVLQN
ncbi:hypothetical protein [Abyssalbus ytuae]|uniref:Uncharacterized protein n=1 Tax=Abyssalbus ytuae TaxID=2926907 RepID=A0A9E6ZN59_9FLAO|nr:hypothetical protein [Abyssalbus ytuae]UOB17370.1 hypothetical protein MQE35_16735 [Abyssalbus ytuae]